MQQKRTEAIMPRTVKAEPTDYARESSFVSLLGGWVQQGVENFFATQRILVDLAMRQNTSAMDFLRQRLADPAYCPAAVLTELAAEGMTNFIEGQKLLLNLAQKEYQIITTGVKERVSMLPAGVAITDMMQRSFDTFVQMQHEFLSSAEKQTHAWLHAAKAGKMYDPEGLIDLARESFDTFVRTQKKFLGVIAEETANATTGNGAKKMKKTELTELAREATESFFAAQKKLMDVADRQVNAHLKATGRALHMLSPMQFMNLPAFTREGVKTFVDAEKAVIDTMTSKGHATRTRITPGGHKARPVRHKKIRVAAAVA
jgi:hypothetical protein